MTFKARILSWRFHHLNIVGCLVKRGLQSSGHGQRRTSPPLLCPWKYTKQYDIVNQSLISSRDMFVILGSLMKILLIPGSLMLLYRN